MEAQDSATAGVDANRLTCLELVPARTCLQGVVHVKLVRTSEPVAINRSHHSPVATPIILMARDGDCKLAVGAVLALSQSARASVPSKVILHDDHRHNASCEACLSLVWF